MNGVERDDAVVGVVGAGRERLADLGDVDVVAGDAAEVVDREPTVVVAVGDTAASSVARAASRVPVLPVEAGRGLRSVPADRLERAIESVLEGSAASREVPVLAVESDAGRERALYDVTVVTEEPARISEYAVECGPDRVTRIRADGVVAATPAGSHDYAAAAGGPIVSGAIEGVTVVPISPFVTRARQWVLPPEVTISIERDEGDVELCTDDRVVGTLTGETAVSISVADTLTVLSPPESVRPFDPD